MHTSERCQVAAPEGIRFLDARSHWGTPAPRERPLAPAPRRGLPGAAGRRGCMGPWDTHKKCAQK
eukprot:5259824-Pyramimonas_sp.AAC.1